MTTADPDTFLEILEDALRRLIGWSSLWGKETDTWDNRNIFLLILLLYSLFSINFCFLCFNFILLYVFLISIFFVYCIFPSFFFFLIFNYILYSIFNLAVYYFVFFPFVCISPCFTFSFSFVHIGAFVLCFLWLFKLCFLHFDLLSFLIFDCLWCLFSFTGCIIGVIALFYLFPRLFFSFSKCFFVCFCLFMFAFTICLGVLYACFLFIFFPFCNVLCKESTCSAEDLSSIPGLGRSPGEGSVYPLQYSGLENSMDSIVYGVAKSRTWLSNFHFQCAVWLAVLVLHPRASPELLMWETWV